MCGGDGEEGQLIDKPQEFLNSTALFGRFFPKGVVLLRFLHRWGGIIRENIDERRASE